MKIRRLDVPDAVRSGTEVRLTCDYDLEVRCYLQFNLLLMQQGLKRIHFGKTENPPSMVKLRLTGSCTYTLYSVSKNVFVSILFQLRVESNVAACLNCIPFHLYLIRIEILQQFRINY